MRSAAGMLVGVAALAVCTLTTLPPLPAKAADLPTKWTLPYSCATVRWYMAHFSRAKLKEMLRLAHIRMPTAAEEAQIAACVAGKLQ